MKNKFLILTLLAAVIFAGCVSIQAPAAHDKSFPPDGRYEILGPTSCSSLMAVILGIVWVMDSTGGRYIDLLETAAKEYEGADDVVNVSVDKKIISYLGVVTTVKTTLRGTAIRYVTAPPAAR